MTVTRNRDLVPIPPLVLRTEVDSETRAAIEEWIREVAEEVLEERAQLQRARTLTRQLRDHEPSSTWDLEECDLLIALCEALGVDDEPGKPPSGQEH